MLIVPCQSSLLPPGAWSHAIAAGRLLCRGCTYQHPEGKSESRWNAVMPPSEDGRNCPAEAGDDKEAAPNHAPGQGDVPQDESNTREHRSQRDEQSLNQIYGPWVHGRHASTPVG